MDESSAYRCSATRTSIQHRDVKGAQRNSVIRLHPPGYRWKHEHVALGAQVLLQFDAAHAN